MVQESGSSPKVSGFSKSCVFGVAGPERINEAIIVSTSSAGTIIIKGLLRLPACLERSIFNDNGTSENIF